MWGLAGQSQRLALTLMGSCWRGLREVIDYDSDQLFLVTSFLPAACVHSGLCVTAQRLVEPECNLPFVLAMKVPESSLRGTPDSPPGLWHHAYFLLVLNAPVTNITLCPYRIPASCD